MPIVSRNSSLKARIVDLQERRYADRRNARAGQAAASLEDAAQLLTNIHKLCELVEGKAQRRQLLGAMLNLQEVMCVLRRVARG